MNKPQHIFSSFLELIYLRQALYYGFNIMWRNDNAIRSRDFSTGCTVKGYGNRSAKHGFCYDLAKRILNGKVYVCLCHGIGSGKFLAALYIRNVQDRLWELSSLGYAAYQYEPVVGRQEP